MRPAAAPVRWVRCPLQLVSEHAFDKLRLIDCLFGEFSAACEAAEVIQETVISEGLKKLVLTLSWKRPLHVVVIVDGIRGGTNLSAPPPACGPVWS